MIKICSRCPLLTVRTFRDAKMTQLSKTDNVFETFYHLRPGEELWVGPLHLILLEAQLRLAKMFH